MAVGIRAGIRTFGGVLGGRRHRAGVPGTARRVAALAVLAVLVAAVPGSAASGAAGVVAAPVPAVAHPPSAPTAAPAAAAAGPAATGVPGGPAAPTPARHPTDGYLALGDSVPFGFTPPEVTAPPAYFDAANFTGYPEDVARALALPVTNAACPGETTASMMASNAQSNGCENSVGSPFGYRTLFPLHVAYSGAQLAFAVRYLQEHPATGLVTLQIGANDALVCQATTADKCTGTDLSSLLQRVGANLMTIYTALRDTAGYRGPIVLVSYYSLDYSTPAQVAATEALNATLVATAGRFGGIVADGFGLFKRASAAFKGNPCTAGLLVPLPAGGCNIHPSASGHLVLADAVEQALAGAHALP